MVTHCIHRVKWWIEMIVAYRRCRLKSARCWPVGWHARVVTSTMSLFACSSADVTLERVRELVGQDQPESLTLEYKERYSPSLVRSVAAMANSYGGLILVGVRDQPGPGRLVGVPEQAVVQIVDACHQKLEPPWQPEIIPVRMTDDEAAQYLLVIRVDPVKAPRPVLIDGAAPIRLQGRNATADRTRLGQLFSAAAPSLRGTVRRLPVPELPTTPEGIPAADFIIRTGLLVPVDDTAAWRPLSERAVEALANSLNSSPLHRVLLGWCGHMGIDGFTPFRRSGYNRARHARLIWQAAVSVKSLYPVEAVASAELPTAYGAPSPELQFTLDVIIRANPYLAAISPPGSVLEASPYRLPVGRLYATLEALVATLTDSAFVTALAGMAGIDRLVVPLPASLDFKTGRDVADLLQPDGLKPIPGAVPARGATLFANPALDLSDPMERDTLVDDWLQQIALDSGLSGMEALLADYHRGHPDGHS